MVRLTKSVPVVFCLLLVAGCSTRGSASGGPPAASPQASATTPAAAPTSATPPTPAAPADASPSPRVPTLGVSRQGTTGYGTVRPNVINNGGDPTGIVTGVSWNSWGGAQATGTGTAYYDPPNVPVFQSIKERATVVAFDPGTCAGRYVYRAVEWYFPESGGSFDPTGGYRDICTWTYHPRATP